MKTPLLILCLLSALALSSAHGDELQLLPDAPAGFVHIREGDERDSGSDFYMNTAQLVSVEISGDRRRPGSPTVLVLTTTAKDEDGSSVSYVIPFLNRQAAEDAALLILQQTKINRSGH